MPKSAWKATTWSFAGAVGVMRKGNSEVTVKELIRPLPGVCRTSLLRQRIGFRSCALYWEQNYTRGGTSGPGSYNAAAEAKAARSELAPAVGDQGLNPGPTRADFFTYHGSSPAPRLYYSQPQPIDAR
jgi:hypothetical protein